MSVGLKVTVVDRTIIERKLIAIVMLLGLGIYKTLNLRCLDNQTKIDDAELLIR